MWERYVIGIEVGSLHTAFFYLADVSSFPPSETYATHHPYPLHFPFSHLQGLVGAPACGDVMKLQIRVDADGKIVESKFKTFGCGSAIASSSVATEWLKGKTVDECLTIKNTDIAAHLKLPPVKLHCSMLAEDAIKAAVKDLATKKGSASAGQEQLSAMA
jgi:nitrogen fixation NifU-like protein